MPTNNAYLSNEFDEPHHNQLEKSNGDEEEFDTYFSNEKIIIPEDTVVT